MPPALFFLLLSTMAVNPILAQDAYTQELFPLPISGEVFFIKRKGIALKADTPTGVLKGNGTFILTSRRIVFLKDGKPNQHREFTSFEIPLHLVSDPKFEQPIFGANYVKGKVDPLIGATNPLPGRCQWYLTFNKGGCGTFLNIFFRLHLEALRNTGWTPTVDLMSQLSQGPGAAFVDPGDPSVVYVSQPVAVAKPSPETDTAGHPPLNFSTPSSPFLPSNVSPGANVQMQDLSSGRYSETIGEEATVVAEPPPPMISSSPNPISAQRLIQSPSSAQVNPPSRWRPNSSQHVQTGLTPPPPIGATSYSPAGCSPARLPRTAATTTTVITDISHHTAASSYRYPSPPRPPTT